MTAYETTYNQLRIGDLVQLLVYRNREPIFKRGFVMDKYLFPDNVAVDVMMEDGSIIEKRMFYKGYYLSVDILAPKRP